MQGWEGRPTEPPNMARILAMRAERAMGWSYDRIAHHHELSPERVAQLIEREPMKSRVYGPWVVFNDVPYLVLMRPNFEARRAAYMRRWRTGKRTERTERRDEMSVYWRSMIVRYSAETGVELVNRDDFRMRGGVQRTTRLPS